MFPMKQYHEAKQGKFIRDPEARRRFQEHDKHVLRFDCVWDNSAAELGDVHHVILQYFLADDMAEVGGRGAGAGVLRGCSTPPPSRSPLLAQVRMLHGSNDGYDRVPCLIRKMPLPKAGTPTCVGWRSGGGEGWRFGSDSKHPLLLPPAHRAAVARTPQRTPSSSCGHRTSASAGLSMCLDARCR